MITQKIQQRRKTFVNTDPQRRCYNGAFYSGEYQWKPWEDLESFTPDVELPQRLEFWKDLNDFAVRERGEGARAEFRIVPKETPNGLWA